MQLYARHGDLVINKADIPSDVKLERPIGALVLAGRESAPHTIERGALLYGKTDAVQFVRAEETVQLTHSNRHNPVTLEPGDYHIYSQREFDGEAERAVED